MKISIIGDSFSSDTIDQSWVSLLAQKHMIDNFSQRGISEYRIYKLLQENLQTILTSDAVIIFHTNPDRIYIPDSTPYPRRRTNTHSQCDMLVNDAFSMPDWAHLADLYYRHFFDSEFQQHIFSCTMKKIIDSVVSVNTVIHCSGFDLTYPDIHSFSKLRQTNPGRINHFDVIGNRQVFNYIDKKLS